MHVLIHYFIIGIVDYFNTFKCEINCFILISIKNSQVFLLINLKYIFNIYIYIYIYILFSSLRGPSPTSH